MTRTDLTHKETDNYFGRYIQLVPADLSLFEALRYSEEQLLQQLFEIPLDIQEYRYADGKWTIKEIIVHLIDTERILNYRALRFARADATMLSGFDQETYVAHCNASDKSIERLIAEFSVVRQSTMLLFDGFSETMLTRTGIASDLEMSVRALGFVQAGHVLHHLSVISEKYL